MCICQQNGSPLYSSIFSLVEINKEEIRNIRHWRAGTMKCLTLLPEVCIPRHMVGSQLFYLFPHFTCLRIF